MTHELPPPLLIEDDRGMQRLLADLERQSEIAVDTEANSFFNFRERVCLIQITAGERDYLVDPLARVDVAPLGRMLADPRRTKVFHDGEYDILIMKRDFRFEFRNLFDTRIAAAALGEQNPGLASVLKARFGIELDKSLQRSNWSARPLSPEQVSYARLDTHFLIPLMSEQQRELELRGRARIVEGECRRLEQLVPPETTFDPDEFIRIKGARNLGPDQQQILRELFVLRQRLAGELDLPPFKVMNNQVLLDIAGARPRNMRELSSIGGFSPRQARRLGDDVLAALRRAHELGPLRRAPSLPARDGTSELTDDEFEMHERLKQWRSERAKREGFDASLVINRHVLMRLARVQPRTLEDLAGLEGMMAWQVEMLGEEILRAIAEGQHARAHEPAPSSRRRLRRGRRPPDSE